MVHSALGLPEALYLTCIVVEGLLGSSCQPEDAGSIVCLRAMTVSEAFMGVMDTPPQSAVLHMSVTLLLYTRLHVHVG